MKRRRLKTNYYALISLAGYVLLLLAVVFISILYLSQIPEVKLWYSSYLEKLTELENAVMDIQQWYLFLIIILLLYAIKSFFPLLQISALCVLTGMVFPIYFALPINVLGIVILMSIKFFWGRKFGGGRARKFIKINDSLLNVVEHDGTGNPWSLFAFRLVPSFPINAVSQLYGSMNSSYKRFILISLAGFTPKILSYTFIGRNAFDPLSFSFLSPIIIILLISGFSLLGLNLVLSKLNKGGT